MAAQLYLIAPPDASPAEFPAALGRILGHTEVAALLLPRGGRPENAYKALVQAVRPVAQGQGTAVLVEGDPGLVRTLGADGLHVATGAEALREAIAALKPDVIVGAGPAGSRHEAMTLGELGADYVLFGPLAGAPSPEQRELAQWWAETMEIPAVLSDPEADPKRFDASGCEFIGLSAARFEDGT